MRREVSKARSEARRGLRVRRLTTMRRDGDASVARYPRKVQKVLKYKKLDKLRDVAQLVARLLWEQDVAGSNPVIPTIKGCLSHSDQASFSFQVRFQSLMFAIANQILFRLWRMYHSDQEHQTDGLVYHHSLECIHLRLDFNYVVWYNLAKI